MFSNNHENASDKNILAEKGIVSGVQKNTFYDNVHYKAEKPCHDYSLADSGINLVFLNAKKENNFSRKIILEKRNIFFLKDTIHNNLDRYLKRAETLTILSSVCCLYFAPGFFVCISLAISNTNKVLKNPNATDEQKRKAYKLKNRAETMLEFSILLIALYIGLIVYIIYNV